jgi:hypothetical protein
VTATTTPRLDGARLLFAAVVVVHLVVLYLPDPPSAGVGLLPYGDLVVHALVFGAVAWTARLARLPLVPVVLLLAAHAGLSEAVQHTLLPGRGGEISDVVADLAGVVLGLVLPLPRREAS